MEQLKVAEKLNERVIELEKQLETQKKSAINSPVVGSKSNSDEQKAMKAFHCSNIKQLLDVNTCSPQFRYVSEELKHQVINLKQTVDTARAIGVMFYGGKTDIIGRADSQDRVADLTKEIAASNFGKDVMLPMTKA